MRFNTRSICIALICALIMTACGEKQHDVERSDLSFDGINNAEILSESGKYPALRTLLGHMTYRDLLELLDASILTINTLSDRGDTRKEDFRTLLNILNNMYAMMREDQQAYESGSNETSLDQAAQALIDLIVLAREAGVGDLLNDVIHQTQTGVLTENLYPMLDYLLAADDDVLSGAFNGISFETISDQDFITLVGFLNKLIDSENAHYNDYADIHTQWDELIQALKTNTQLDLTYGSLHDLLEDENVSEAEAESSSPDLAVLKAVAGQIGDLWDEHYTDNQTEVYPFRNDLKVILAGLGALMTELVAAESSNAWDANGQTDFERLLYSVEDILGAPGSTQRTSLAAFLRSAMTGMQSIMDADTLTGILAAIGTEDMDNDGIPDIENNTTYIDAVDKGLMGAVRNNMYALDRVGANTKISALRVIAFMMEQADVNNAVLASVSSADGGTVNGTTTNIAEWTIGELVTAMGYAAQGIRVADYNGNGMRDDFDALYWLLYKKRYTVMGMTLTGMVDVIKTAAALQFLNLMPVGVIDSTPALVDLSGCISSTGSYSESTWKTNDADGNPLLINPGSRHQLFSLFAPLMEYFWDTGRCQDLIDLLIAMDEIGTYHSLSSILYTPTFEADNYTSALRKIEGPHGYGPIYYALRKHTAGADDGVLLDAMLDLIMRVVDKLDSTPYTNADGSTTTVLAAFIDSLGMAALDTDDIDELMTTLFGADGSSGLVQDLYLFLTRADAEGNARINHLALVSLSQSLGELLLACADDFDTLAADLEIVGPILSEMVEIDASDGTNTLGDLLDYLTAPNADGSDNPFMENLGRVTTRLLDVRDPDFNPNGAVTDDTRVLGPQGMLVHLLGDVNGDGGLYRLARLQDFLVRATRSPQDILLPVYKEGGDLLDRVLGGESLSMSFVRALFLPADINTDGSLEDSVAYQLCEAVHLEADMQAVLEDLAGTVVTEGLLTGTDLRPGSEAFTTLLKVLEFAVKGGTITE